jgi:hypothetical protein
MIQNVGKPDLSKDQKACPARVVDPTVSQSREEVERPKDAAHPPVPLATRPGRTERSPPQQGPGRQGKPEDDKGALRTLPSQSGA